MSAVVLESVIARWCVVDAPDRDAWLEARRQYLTASDVAAVLGLHPYKGRAKVLAEKRAGVAGEARAWTFESSAMRAGQYLEEPVFRWWLDDQNAKAARVQSGEAWLGSTCRGGNGQSLLVRHPDASLQLAASPDGLAVEAGSGRALLVEVKIHGPKQWAKWTEWTPKHNRAHTLYRLPTLTGDAALDAVDEADPIWPPCPLQHWVQLQTQLLCTGELGGVVLGNCGSERREHYFEADRAFHGHIERAAREFWAEVGGSLEEELS